MRSTHALAGWLFAAPALTVIVVFFGLPVLAAFVLSLTDFDIYALADIGNLRFVGVDNYLGLLQNPLFWKSLGNTVYFVVGGVVGMLAGIWASRFLSGPALQRVFAVAIVAVAMFVILRTSLRL